MKLITLVSLLLALNLVCGACSSTKNSTNQTQSVNVQQLRANKGPSVYAFKATLTNQSGNQINWDLYKGYPVVVSMFYASCDYSCPLLINALQKMQTQLDDQIRNRVRYLLISIDPKKDTPAVLLERHQHYRFLEHQWTLAATDESTTREIAAILGINYRNNKKDSHHSSRVILLDVDGGVVKKVDGIQDAVTEITQILNQYFKP